MSPPQPIASADPKRHDREPASSASVEHADEVHCKLQPAAPKTDDQRQSGESLADDKCEPDADQARMKRRAKSHKAWNRSLKLFFCCLGYKKNKDSFANVANTFADLFSELRVPSSDLAAGFVLLSKYQEAQRSWTLANRRRPPGFRLDEPPIEQYLSSVAITRNTKFLDVSEAANCQLVYELIYYMNYSLAIFGWPLQMIDEPRVVCCICPYLRCRPGASCCCCCCRRKKAAPGDSFQFPVVLEDNCCGCNMASAERRLAEHNYDIIYINYRVKVSKVPFLVAADHSKRTIVIAIRGSMSQADMMTDMDGQPVKLPLEGCPDDWIGHRGIVQAAKYVHDTLVERKILEQALACRPELASDQYSIVICGHSLGAGAASILGILLRPKYPTLRAFLYSPPGGILSLPAVEYTKQFATGILLGNDCVPRLGLAQLERLRYYLLLSLKNSNLSARKILARALCCSSCCLGETRLDYDPDFSADVLHATSGAPFEYKGSVIPFQCQQQVLYVPGRLIHVVKNFDCLDQRKDPKARNNPIFQAVWTENTDYDKIMVAEGMFNDHMPNRLMHSMKMLMSRTLPARAGLGHVKVCEGDQLNEAGRLVKSYHSFGQAGPAAVIEPMGRAKDKDAREGGLKAPSVASYSSSSDNNNNNTKLDDQSQDHEPTLGSQSALHAQAHSQISTDDIRSCESGVDGKTPNVDEKGKTKE